MRGTLGWLLCAAAVVLVPSHAAGQPAQASPVAAVRAVLRKLSGDVGIRRTDGDWQLVTEGQEVVAGDQLHTGADSEVTIAISDGSTVRVTELSQVSIGALLASAGKAKVQILLKIGGLDAKVNPGRVIQSDFSIKTPTATASVKGTEFKRVSFYPPRGTEVELLTGKVLIEGNKGKVETGPYEPSIVRENGFVQTPGQITADAARVHVEPVGLTSPEVQQISVTNQPQANPVTQSPSSGMVTPTSGGSLVFRYVLQ